MVDRVSTQQRSRNMAAVRGVNTKPEIYVRQKLFAAGFRYRLHSAKLAGKPDIALARFRTAVFVHGCFWHGHSCSRGRRPKSNVEFWNEKIDANVHRDRRALKNLRASGWRTVVIWECSLKRATGKLLNSLKARGLCRIL
jgi:DNA mismatch endonuclease (patch repair protein)